MGKIIGVWLGLELLLAVIISYWLGLGTLLLSWLIAALVGGYLLRGLGEHLRGLRQGAAGMALSGPLARVGAAVLFIIPGTLTDVFALMLLIPATQTRFAKRWGASSSTWSGAHAGGAQHGGRQNGFAGDKGDVIEGEWVEEAGQNPRIGPHQ